MTDQPPFTPTPVPAFTPTPTPPYPMTDNQTTNVPPPVKPKAESVASIDAIDTGKDEPCGNTATPIVRFGELSVVVVSTKGRSSTADWNSVVLPKDAQILDEVEVYCGADSTGTVLVFPNKGESIGAHDKSTGSNSRNVAVGAGTDGICLRKVSASRWVVRA